MKQTHIVLAPRYINTYTCNTIH